MAIQNAPILRHELQVPRLIASFVKLGKHLTFLGVYEGFFILSSERNLLLLAHELALLHRLLPLHALDRLLSRYLLLFLLLLHGHGSLKFFLLGGHVCFELGHSFVIPLAPQLLLRSLFLHDCRIIRLRDFGW